MIKKVSLLNKILEVILKNEGGFVNDPYDLGGATNFGITEKTLEDFLGKKVTIQEVKDLDIELAKKIYILKYYTTSRIDEFPNSMKLNLFDMLVHSGEKNTMLTLQKAINQTFLTSSSIQVELIADGIGGSKTISACYDLEKIFGFEIFRKVFLTKRKEFLEKIILKAPEQMVFFIGWMNRLDNLAKIDL